MTDTHDNLMEVDYETYCPKCKYRFLPETKDPCNICLDNCVRESTRVPEYFKEK